MERICIKAIRIRRLLKLDQQCPAVLINSINGCRPQVFNSLLNCNFTTSACYDRRGGPRPKVRQQQEECLDNRSLEGVSEETKFALMFKDKLTRPQEYLNNDEEWVAYRRYGRIRVDSENKRKVFPTSRGKVNQAVAQGHGSAVDEHWEFSSDSALQDQEHQLHEHDHGMSNSHHTAVKHNDAYSPDLFEKQAHSSRSKQFANRNDFSTHRANPPHDIHSRNAHVHPLFDNNDSSQKTSPSDDRNPRNTNHYSQLDDDVSSQRTRPAHDRQAMNPNVYPQLKGDISVQRTSPPYDRQPRNPNVYSQLYDDGSSQRTKPAYDRQPRNPNLYPQLNGDISSQRTSPPYDRKPRNPNVYVQSDNDYSPQRATSARPPLDQRNKNSWAPQFNGELDNSQFDGRSNRLSQDGHVNNNTTFSLQNRSAYTEGENAFGERTNSDFSDKSMFYRTNDRYDRRYRNENAHDQSARDFRKGPDRHVRNGKEYSPQSRHVDNQDVSSQNRQYRNRHVDPEPRQPGRNVDPELRQRGRNFNPEPRQAGKNVNPEPHQPSQNSRNHYRSDSSPNLTSDRYEKQTELTPRNFKSTTSDTHKGHTSEYIETEIACEKAHAHEKRGEHNPWTQIGLDERSETMFESQYFQDVHNRQSPPPKNSTDKVDTNIFEEQYFEGVQNTDGQFSSVQNTSGPFTTSTKQNSNTSVNDAFNMQGFMFTDEQQSIENYTFKQHIAGTNNEQVDSNTTEAGRSDENLIEEQFFHNKDNELLLPWDSVEKVESRTHFSAQLPGTTFTGENPIEEQYFHNKDDALQLPWDTVETDELSTSAAGGKSKSMHTAERNDMLLTRGLKSMKSQSGLYVEKDQMGMSRGATNHQHSHSDFYGIGTDSDRYDRGPEETARNAHAQTWDTSATNAPSFGQHPKSKFQQPTTYQTEGRTEMKDKGPITVAQMRQKLAEDRTRGDSGKTTKSSPVLQGVPGLQDWQIHKKWQGKVDSKGFRILKEQVPDMYKMTADELVQMIKRDILYEDDDLLAINKPYGLPSHGGPKVNHSVASLMSQLASELMGCEELYMCHRLDHETTGVMLLAKNKATCELLNGMFRRREVVKQYLTITKGCPKPIQGIIDIPMIESEVKATGQQRMCLMPANTPEYVEMLKDAGKDHKNNLRESKPAVTNYRVLDTASETALVLCQPETGVKHQIRCHLSHGMNTPILGDHKYSHFDKLAPQKLHPETLQRLGIRKTKVRHVPMHLHAKQLILPQYRNGRNFFVSARVPKFFTQNMKWLKLELKK